MELDDSFTKQGTVPFKWEIRPGVPKVRHQQPQSDHDRSFAHHHQKQLSEDRNRSFPSTPQKLRPPPSVFYLDPPPELRTRSFRSAPRIHSKRRDFSNQPDIIPSGCFSSPLLKRKDDKKGTHKLRPQPNYMWNLETSSRLPKSKPESPLPFYDLPSSSSFSSYRSTARPVSDAEWAAFGLF